MKKHIHIFYKYIYIYSSNQCCQKINYRALYPAQKLIHKCINSIKEIKCDVSVQIYFIFMIKEAKFKLKSLGN